MYATHEMSAPTTSTADAGGVAAFATLQRAYRDRLAAARLAHAAGASVVGLIGNSVPIEFVLAAGRVPVLIAAERGEPTPTADIYMDQIIAPETKSLFEHTVGGSYSFVDLLVLSRPYAQLYYYLKEVYRMGRGPNIPPLHIYDLMHSQRQAVRTYNWGRTLALVEQLERLAQHEITEARLWEAITATNRGRGLQRRLLEHRWAAALSGVDALQAIGAGYFLQPDSYANALEAYLAELQPKPELHDRPRLLVITSEPLSHLFLHTALEEVGGLVVAEDDWWGSRAPGDDVPLAGSAREAIFRKYWLDVATAGIYPADAREAWLRRHALRTDLDGVIFYLPPSDHQLGWDYPRLKHWLDAHDKPSLLLRHDAAAADGSAAIRVEATAFVERLRAGHNRRNGGVE
jgi:benzoyl-CoA reductase/2-hydroxyglutaryl-CoA dehydratase subunit BcrC/BadD/HgdB